MNDFEKDIYKLLSNAFYGKTRENIRNRIKIELIKQDDNETIFKQRSKLTFNGIHRSYTTYDSYTFKQNEVLMDKPIYLRFAIIELSKLLMYEIYYRKLQPYFGQDNLQLSYMDCDSLKIMNYSVIRIKTLLVILKLNSQNFLDR